MAEDEIRVHDISECHPLEALPYLEVTFTGNYCKGSITNVGTVSDNEANFLPFPYEQFIVLPPGRITA